MYTVVSYQGIFWGYQFWQFATEGGPVVMLDGRDLGNPASWPTYKKKAVVRAIQMPHPFQVDTLEGQGLRGKAGDYLCQGIKGEFWPIDREIFEESYERE